MALNMYDLIGKRLRVKGSGDTDLGLGTYLWDDDILLDSGKKVRGAQCKCELAPKSPVPPFEITLRGDTRVFRKSGGLQNTGTYLSPGIKITIVEVTTCGWNHGNYVAGKFFYDGSEPFWFVMSEVELPFETPHLQLVR
jgi:hypothetical protein